MPRSQKVPAYRLHKQSGQAIVTLVDLAGVRKDVLLGRYGTDESREHTFVLSASGKPTAGSIPRRQRATGFDRQRKHPRQERDVGHWNGLVVILQDTTSSNPPGFRGTGAP